MALTMDALLAPLNNFFLERFGSSGAASIVFRFDKFGSKVSQDDFRVDPTDPQSPFSAAIAREKMSDLANRLPTDAGDGASVAFLADTVDASYEQLLRSAQPYLPPEADDQRRKEIIRSFAASQAEAIKLYERAEMTSVSGAPVGVRLTDFAPADWYDLADSAVWTSHSFRVGEQDQPSSSPPIQWRTLPPSRRLEEIVASVRPGVASAIAAPRAAPFVRDEVIVRPVIPPRDDLATADSFDDTLKLMVRGGPVGFDVLDRLRFKEVLLTRAPAAEVTTSQVDIAFEYCLVSTNRKWLRSSFLSANNWVIPDQAVGSANQPGRPGSLMLLPLAFLAVRKLSIRASWSEADRQILQNAMSWGPFEIVPSIGTGAVAQPGLQIVGWVLQKVPPLPPKAVSEALPTETVPRTYRVQSGDTLRKIATKFYGDPDKYVVIQEANDIFNPDLIKVGQILQVP